MCASLQVKWGTFTCFYSVTLNISGDAAYPLAHNLITPFRNTGNLTPQQRFYNTKISSIRQKIERAIGHLKCRFRRLRDIYCRNIKNACYLITSACILHNLCIVNDDHVEDYIHLDNAQQDQVRCCGFLFQRNIGGVNRRNRLVHDLSRYMRWSISKHKTLEPSFALMI